VFDKMLLLQEQYDRKRVFTMTGLLDQFVRVISSIWESGFSFSILMVFKFMDLVNDLKYKGRYGVSIDASRFTMNDLARRLTMIQISRLNKKGERLNYHGFRKNYKNKMFFLGSVREDCSTVPDYYTAIPVKGNFFYRLLSFRTWHNFNVEGEYPVADYLYKNYRVFSRIVLFFRPWGWFGKLGRLKG